MPRLGGGNVGQSYLIGLSDGKNNNATTGSDTTTSLSPASFSHSSFLPAPSSLNNSLPRIPSMPRAPSSLKNNSAMLMNRSPRPGNGGMFLSPGSIGAPGPSNNNSNSNSMLLSPGSVSSIGLSPRRMRKTVQELPTVASDIAPRQPKRNILRAAEGGRGSLLPDFNAPRQPPNRVETRSSPSLKVLMNLQKPPSTLPRTMQDVAPKVSVLQAAKQSLRRRATSCPSDDEDFVSRRGGHRESSDSPYRSSRRGGRRGGSSYSYPKLSRMKLGHILQVVIVVAVTALVWESHHKALFAAQQLSRFKEEESLLLLHLQKIEQQSIQLHENLSRLAQSGVRVGEQKKPVSETVDFDLIHKQTQQLYQMEEELNHEVRTLQTRIQQSARNHIIQEFGEGPVQVLLEMDFGNHDGPDRISILLWHDTPHAAWTWLEQIGRHVWDGAEFKWQEGHVIDAIPLREDPLGGKIEFVEQSQHGHEAWTVGVRETDTGAMQMYINLQDNTNLHKHETCVGKVIDGFDALQRLLEVSRSQRYEKDASIPIRKANAMHVTKKEGVS